MSPNQVCKLGPEACTLLTQVLQRCNDWQCVIAGLKDAGLDVSAQENELAAQQQLAAKLKAMLFPHMP